jgi:hypothetical protein
MLILDYALTEEPVHIQKKPILKFKKPHNPNKLKKHTKRV